MTDIDITKPVRTKDGQTVEIVTDKGRGTYPFLGYVGDETLLKSWARDGKCYIGGSSLNDIENVPERREWFYNVYEHYQHGWFYKTKEEAGKYERCQGRLAILRMTFEGNRLVSVDIVERFGEGGE